MFRTIPLLVLIGVSLLGFPASALDQSAPFGFSWGPVDKVPTPSLATREDNITLLMYRRDRLPTNELRDTEEIVLEVCEKEGLQQIVWVSKFLSASEEQHELEAILAEATRRYGKAEMAERGIIRWNAGQTALAVISNDQGLNRIVMVSIGPGFNTCSEKHKSITGHPLSDHWMRFLPNN